MPHSVEQPWCDGELHNKGLAFVPILLDNDARAWWASVPEDERCPDWVWQYGYEDFTGPDGTPAAIISEYGPVDRVTSRIEEIARRLKQAYADRWDASLEPRAPPPAATSPIVILGHPTAALPTSVAKAVASLAADLSGRGVEPVAWQDGWLGDAMENAGPAASLPHGAPLVIQPVPPGEARDHLNTPGLARQRLGQALEPAATGTGGALAGCRIVLWAPQGVARSPDLQRAIENWTHEDPALRVDTPADLAAWLLERAGHDPRPEVPLLTLEDLATDDPRVAAVRTQLHWQFERTIKRVVRPAPVWTFTSRDLLEQLRELRGGRAIVAVHDLNTGHARDKQAARAELRQKLEHVQADVEREFPAGSERPDIFWAALIHRKAECILSVRLGDGVLDRWRALRFWAREGGLVADDRDEPVFRSYVSEWVAATAAAPPPAAATRPVP